MYLKRFEGWALALSALMAAPAMAAPPACEIPALEKDLSYYHGEHQTQASPGWEESDFGKAAEQQALAELGKSIRVTIESGADLHVQWRQKGDRENFEQTYREFIKTYGNVLIPHYEKRTCLDYPAKGMVTVLVFGRKDEIENQIARDLKDKTTGVRSLIEAADRAMAARSQVLGLRQLLRAQEQLHRSFKYDEPAGLSADITKRMTDFLGGLHLAAEPAAIRFDAAGKPKSAVAIKATFGEKHLPVSGLALSFFFRKGSGTLRTRKGSTDSGGKAVLPLTAVVPSQTSATIEARLDASAFPGLPAGETLPRCSITLSHGKSVALVVRRIGDAARSSHPPLEDRLGIVATRAGLSPIKIDQGDDATVFSKAQRAGADYILLVDLTAKLKTNPADADLHAAEVSSLVSLKSLKDDWTAGSTAGPKEQSGIFADDSAAVDSGLDKLEPALSDLVKQKLLALPK